MDASSLSFSSGVKYRNVRYAQPHVISISATKKEQKEKKLPAQLYASFVHKKLHGRNACPLARTPSIKHVLPLKKDKGLMKEENHFNRLPTVLIGEICKWLTIQDCTTLAQCSKMLKKDVQSCLEATWCRSCRTALYLPNNWHGTQAQLQCSHSQMYNLYWSRGLLQTIYRTRLCRHCQGTYFFKERAEIRERELRVLKAHRVRCFTCKKRFFLSLDPIWDALVERTLTINIPGFNDEPQIVQTTRRTHFCSVECQIEAYDHHDIRAFLPSMPVSYQVPTCVKSMQLDSHHALLDTYGLIGTSKDEAYMFRTPPPRIIWPTVTGPRQYSTFNGE